MRSAPPGNPRLMLLDLHMPKIDGLDVLAQIKTDPQTRSTPVVIMSSSDQESDMPRSYAAAREQLHRQAGRFQAVHRPGSLLGQYWTRVNRAGP